MERGEEGDNHNQREGSMSSESKEIEKRRLATSKKLVKAVEKLFIALLSFGLGLLGLLFLYETFWYKILFGSVFLLNCFLAQRYHKAEREYILADPFRRMSAEMKEDL